MAAIDISEELRSESRRLLSLLKDAAIAKRVTSKQPKKARDIVMFFAQHFNVKISDTDIRAMVNYQRVQGELIGSNSNGYWYMLDGDGEEHTASQLESRLASICEAYHGMWPRRFPALLDRIRTDVAEGGQLHLGS